MSDVHDAVREFLSGYKTISAMGEQVFAYSLLPDRIDTDTRAQRELVERAKTDPAAFDAAVTLFERLSREGALPYDLRRFAVKVMTGVIRRPSKRGRSANANFTRDNYICMAVELAHRDFGLHYTRNDAAEACDSACDVVAECLRSLGVKPDTYAAVAKIWENRDPEMF